MGGLNGGSGRGAMTLSRKEEAWRRNLRCISNKPVIVFSSFHLSRRMMAAAAAVMSRLSLSYIFPPSGFS